LASALILQLACYVKGGTANEIACETGGGGRIWRILSVWRNLRALDEVFGTPLSLASDWVAGFALVAGGTLSARNWLDGQGYQLVGWAFMASLLPHSFFGNVEDIITHAPDAIGSTGLVPIAQTPYTLIVGVLCALSFVGLWATLITMRRRNL